MLVYLLDLSPEVLYDLSKNPEGIYSEISAMIPQNLDRRIFNNTVYYYFEQISTLPELSLAVANTIRFQYMRFHQAPLYGDMDEIIYIPTFEGGHRVAERNRFIQTVPVKRDGKSGECID